MWSWSVLEEASLPEDAPLQPNGQVPGGLARDRDESRLGGMLVLAMATTCPAEHPSIILDQPDDLADLHPLASPPRLGRRRRTYRVDETDESCCPQPAIRGAPYPERDRMVR